MDQTESSYVPTHDILLTPGPISCRDDIKQQMMTDYGSRDKRFLSIVGDVRSKLLEISNTSSDTHTTVLMQGCGTMGIESVISSVVPRDGVVAVFSNGSYGRRAVDITSAHGIKTHHIKLADNKQVTPTLVRGTLETHPEITHVHMVHHETTTGTLNPVRDIGKTIRAHNPYICFSVDAMSSYGGIPLDIADAEIDFLISSANKCVESVPGFSYVIAKRTSMERAQGNSRTMALDLFAQWDMLETSGQFRFTPPTHTIVAFNKAIDVLVQEGGIEARYKRYVRYNMYMREEMGKIGFVPYENETGNEAVPPVITSYRYPTDTFDFEKFYTLLAEKQVIIFPGRTTAELVFRIGNIGAVTWDEFKYAVRCMKEVVGLM
jgi:2-aminoethylphosphonate-pyruvate transaminase